MLGPSHGSVLPLGDGRNTKTWFSAVHPLPTWGLGIAIGPFETTRESIPLAGDRTLEVNRCFLPADREAFLRSTAELPAILRHLESTFGPYPFGGEPLNLVQTLAGSSSHATWVGIGSGLLLEAPQEHSQPEDDSRALEQVTRALAHELGHQWWGIGLSASSWCDAWLHESFASYGELTYLGASRGAGSMEIAFQNLVPDISPKHRLWVCHRAQRTAGMAAQPVLWFKGPWVLRTLAWELGGTAQLNRCLAAFQEQYRHSVASTEDLKAVLQRETGRSWDRFFEEWFRGRGYPRVRGVVQVEGDRMLVSIRNDETGGRRFHVPVEVCWNSRGREMAQSVMLEPGHNQLVIAADQPQDVRVRGLDEVLGLHHVRVVTPAPQIALPGGSGDRK
ncbi:MAG: M1 family aminopeptidase [Planctomycetota bacterium]